MSGFPSPKMTAPKDKRYIGKYYYLSYWDCWDKIIGFTPDGAWIVQDHLTGVVRTHRTPMWANHFADKPFAVHPSTRI